MGNVTAKTSGDIASFMTPAETNIKSLKVHFSPKQLGTGDPSPENIREIEGCDSVEITKSSINLLDQSHILKASGWILSSDDDNTMYCGVPVYKGNINKFYTKFKNGYPFIGNPFKENVQYNVSAWLKTVNGNSIQGLKFGFKYTDGTTSLGGIFAANDTWKRQTVTSKANKTVSGIYCSYNNSGEIYLCGLAVCEKELDDINIVYSSTANDISYQWKKLPDEYQEVEYIENTGTQYIETNFIPTMDATVSVEWDFMFTVAQNGDQMMFGARDGTKRSVQAEFYNQRSWYVRVATKGYIGISDTLSIGTKYSAKCDNEHFLVNNKELSPTEDNNTGTLVPLYIFAWNYRQASSSKYINKGLRMYKLIFKNGNTETANFVPCYRKSDGEIGMYDIVSQTFYTNQGTGKFLKGEDVFSNTVYGGYINLISGELVEDMRYKQITADSLSNAGDYIGYTSSVTALGNQSAVWVRNLFNSTAKGRKSGGIKANCNAFKVLMNSTGVSSSQNRTAFAVDNSITNVSDFISAVETLEQNDNGLYLAYELAEPITHQLTPIQLSSFIGQNNFWSNADYVEIEYELKETEDIQKVRKKIVLNQPHIESVKDDSISFTTDMKAPLKECKVYFEPVQEGEGDPSPDNVRNIIGWDKVEVKNGDNVYSINWTNDVGTVYGGYVDLIKGELVGDMAMVEFDGSSDENWQVETLSSGLTNYYMYSTSLVPKARGNQRTDGYICSNMCISRGENETYTSGMFYFSNSGALNVYLGGKSNTSTVAEFKSWLTEHKLQIAYWLAEPIHYQLTPQQILSLKGINNFSCGIKNDLSVKYWNHKKFDSSNIAYEAKNLTFDGTNYIDTGVYLFSEKNINRDFEVVIEDLYGGDSSNKTIVCAKYDSTATGFLIRLNSATSVVYNGTISMRRDNYNNITIKRVNGVITISGNEITNPKVKFTNAVHQHPLVLGCALQDDGTPYRYEAGTIGYITVKWL